MRTTKLTVLAAASALAMGLTAANAAVTVTDTDRTEPYVLDANSSISIRNNDVVLNGPLVEDDNDGSFFTGTNFNRVWLTADVNDTTGSPAGIANFEIEFFTDAAMTQSVLGPILLTGADGAELDPGAILRVDLPTGVEIFFQVTGIGQSTDAAFNGDYNVTLQADAVPVPAAGLLFGTAALGGAIARRKRKSA